MPRKPKQSSLYNTAPSAKQLCTAWGLYRRDEDSSLTRPDSLTAPAELLRLCESYAKDGALVENAVSRIMESVDIYIADSLWRSNEERPVLRRIAAERFSHAVANGGPPQPLDPGTEASILDYCQKHRGANKELLKLFTDPGDADSPTRKTIMEKFSALILAGATKLATERNTPGRKENPSVQQLGFGLCKAYEELSGKKVTHNHNVNERHKASDASEFVGKVLGVLFPFIENPTRRNRLNGLHIISAARHKSDRFSISTSNVR